MEGRLFEDLVGSRPGGRTTPAGGLPFSLAVHALALAALLVLAVASPEDLPITTHGRIPDFPGVVVHAAPAPAGPARRPAIRRPAHTPRLAALPSEAALVEEPSFDDPFGPVGDPGDVGGCLECEPGVDGGGDGPPGGVGMGPAAGIVDHPPVRVGGHIQPPRKIRHVDPAYPELARRAGVTGMVILECVIDREGRIRSVGVLRGHPLLDAAATEAVRQWTYRPTLLNGVPVEIVMTVTVRFATR